jgi:Glycosyl transferase family 2
MALYASITGDLTDRALAELQVLPSFVAATRAWPSLRSTPGGRIRERARRLAKTPTSGPWESSVRSRLASAFGPFFKGLMDLIWNRPAAGLLACAMARRGRGAMTVQAFAEVPGPPVSIVIPALNEARNIPHVFSRIPSNVHEVILVDGHSVDGTVAVARQLKPNVRIVRQTRTGKGNALACGFAAATGDIIAMVDADGSADPAEIPRFVTALLGGADFAKGSRFLQGGGSGDITRFRALGNRLLTGFFNACYGRSYSDLCYGFNVFWRRHSPLLGLDSTSPSPLSGDGRLWGDGFEVETLIHVRTAKAQLAVVEVPSFEHPRIHGVSNLNAFRDGVRVVRTILTEWRRNPRSRAATAVSEPTRLPCDTSGPSTLGHKASR